MKRILSVILTLIFILAFFTNCSDTSSNEQTNKEHNQEVKDIFLIRNSEGNIGASSEVIADASEYGIDTLWETTTLDDIKNKEKNIAGEDRTFKYTKTKMFYKNSQAKDYGTFYSVYDTYSYTSEDGKTVEWDFLHNTDIIVGYSSNEVSVNPDGVFEEITEDKGKQIAEQFLKKFISDEVFDKFTYYKTSETVFGMKAVAYIRYIEDYQTDEMLSIFITKEGLVSGYNGVNLQKYDSLLNNLTKEKLDAAHNKLKDKIESFNDEKVVYYEPIVVTNTSGNPYLELFYSYNDGMIESLLVNIH